jgi:O-antigen ligase
MPGRYHVTGLFGHHLTAASVMPFAFLWLVGEFLSPQERSLSRWARAILGVFLVAACVVLFLIHSRILWLALPLGLLSFAIRIFWDSNYVRARPLRLLTLFAVSAVLIGLWYALSDPTIRGRIYKPDGLDLPMGVSERLGIWKVNWELFLERPLLGVGWHKNLELGGYLQLSRVPEGSSVFSGHAHNNIIELLASTGILGVSAFLTWQFWILRTTASLGVRGFAWLVAWGVFHLQGLTQVNLFDSKVLHTLAWVIAWTLVWKEEERA